MQKIIRTIYEFAFMTYAGLYLIEYILINIEWDKLLDFSDLDRVLIKIECRNNIQSLRSAPGSDQEQLNEEAGVQDIDGDSPPRDRGDGQCP